jgi:Fe2+ or Zn2+ uptake regulation protein
MCHDYREIQDKGTANVISRYDHTTQTLKGFLVCDKCGEDIREVYSQPYTAKPKFDETS